MGTLFDLFIQSGGPTRQMFSEKCDMVGTFLWRHSHPTGKVVRIEIVIQVARCDVHVKVPHLLIPGRLIMLPDGYPIAVIHLF